MRLGGLAAVVEAPKDVVVMSLAWIVVVCIAMTLTAYGHALMAVLLLGCAFLVGITAD